MQRAEQPPDNRTESTAAKAAADAAERHTDQLAEILLRHDARLAVSHGDADLDHAHAGLAAIQDPRERTAQLAYLTHFADHTTDLVHQQRIVAFLDLAIHHALIEESCRSSDDPVVLRLRHRRNR